MFKTELTAVATGASTASIENVAKFMEFAVSRMGLGLSAVASGGDATVSGDDITAWTATGKVNGMNASVAFTAVAQTFAGIAYEGTTAAAPTARELWTVEVKIDGADANTTLESTELLLKVSAVV